MSRLIDKFTRAAQTSSPSMGFRANRTAPPEPAIVLIISAGIEAIEAIGGDIKNAGAVLLHAGNIKLTDKAVKKVVEALPDIPWGLYFEDGADIDISALGGAGADFVIFPASGHIWLPEPQSKIGRILELDSSIDDGLIRAANSLPVDTFMIEDTFEGGSLNWHQLMVYQHMNNLLSKPIIINAPGTTTEAEIKTLGEAGIDGMVIKAEGIGKGRLAELREIIVKLPPRSARKKNKIDVRLPSLSGTTEPSSPPPDEEEGDE